MGRLQQAWKDPHRTRLGQLIEGCTPEYTVRREQKIENIVLPPARVRVSVLDPTPERLLEVGIVRSKFASKRLEMEQKYKRL